MRGPRNIPCAMHSTDQAEELRKLETLYEQMSDGELRALDEKPEDLTDIAQQVLRVEVARRGLQAQPSDGSTQDCDFTEDDFVGVWKASSLSEAEAIKQILDYAGVSSCLVPDDARNMDPAPKGTDLGIDVKVVRCQVQRALDAIFSYHSDLYAAYPSSAPKRDEDKAYSASCPGCGSQDVVFLGLTGNGAGGTAGDRKFNWTCDACGHRWQDDGNEESR